MLWKINEDDTKAFKDGQLAGFFYADDPLLRGASKEKLQRFLDSVATVVAKYRLQLHNGKSQLLQARLNLQILGPDGSVVETTN